MAMFDLEEFISERPVEPGAFRILRRAAESVRQWRLRRHTTAQLARLSDEMRRDVGFEPACAYDPTNGGARALWKMAHFGPDIR